MGRLGKGEGARKTQDRKKIDLEAFFNPERMRGVSLQQRENRTSWVFLSYTKLYRTPGLLHTGAGNFGVIKKNQLEEIRGTCNDFDKAKRLVLTGMETVHSFEAVQARGKGQANPRYLQSTQACTRLGSTARKFIWNR